jgi:IS30 family transposase
MRSDALVAHTCDKLRVGWTPQLIAGRLPIDHPDDPKMRVCAETLYQWIYSDQQKHRQLMDYLPRAHRKRRKKTGRRVNRSKPPGRHPIGSRPSSASDRTEFGHWEGDSIIGATKNAAIRTEVERKTRYLQVRLVSATSQAAPDSTVTLPPRTSRRWVLLRVADPTLKALLVERVKPWYHLVLPVRSQLVSQSM